MGGGMAGNFGGTAGNSREKILDSLSNLLTAASLIPGLDTFADLAAIPVDLAKGDYVSAGLSALGAIPFVGEVADTAKIARVADKAIDSAKTVNKISDTGKLIKIPKLPKTPSKLKSNGWKETTSVAMKKTRHHEHSKKTICQSGLTKEKRCRRLWWEGSLSCVKSKIYR